MEILNTNRLSLRTWTTDNISSAISIWGDEEVMKYIDSGAPLTQDQISRSIQSAIAHQEKHGFQHWAVVEKSTSLIIGACGFNKTESFDEIELVFHFRKASWGQGFATEAALACIEFARTEIKPTKIIAGCHLNNESSKKVLIKCGFTYKGTKWFADTKTEEPYFELIIDKVGI